MGKSQAIGSAIGSCGRRAERTELGATKAVGDMDVTDEEGLVAARVKIDTARARFRGGESLHHKQKLEQGLREQSGAAKSLSFATSGFR